uniref:Uncharacterized protein n=1 Tax=viral metagenome TaxID=1070528 RepID=A0A6C0D0V5_9ZZZZ
MSAAPYSAFTDTSYSYPNLRLVYIYGTPTLFEQLISAHKEYVNEVSELATSITQIVGGDLAEGAYSNFTDAAAWTTKMTAAITASSTESQNLTKLRNRFLQPSMYSSAETYANGTFWATFSATDATTPSAALSVSNLASYIATQIETDLSNYDDNNIVDGWFLFHVSDFEAIIASVSEMVKTLNAIKKFWQNLDNSLSNFSASEFCLRITTAVILTKVGNAISHCGSTITKLIALKVLIQSGGNSSSTSDIIAATNASLVLIQALFADIKTDFDDIDVAVKAVYNPAATSGLLASRTTADPSI